LITPQSYSSIILSNFEFNCFSLCDVDEEMICPVEVVEDLSMGRNNLAAEEVTSNETIPSKWTIYEDINSLFPIPLPNGWFEFT